MYENGIFTIEHSRDDHFNDVIRRKLGDIRHIIYTNSNNWDIL